MTPQLGSQILAAIQIECCQQCELSRKQITRLLALESEEIKRSRRDHGSVGALLLCEGGAIYAM